MKTALIGLVLSALPLFGCPDIEKAAQKYIEENYPAEEGKPSGVEHRNIRLNSKVNAVQLTVPDTSEEKNAPSQQFLLFFKGGTECEFIYQADGEFTEAIDAGATKYVFVKTEDSTNEEHHANYQVVTVRATGEVANTHDQHGQEIYFSETVQNRCNGKVGEVTHFTRDNADKSRVTLRAQHTDRDGKCRVTEDSSTYRYYRLTAEHWELDDGENDTERPVISQKTR